jgi:hypothetical protein
MHDVPVSSGWLLDRLCLEEQQLKRLGLNAQAAGVRTAITILIRESQENSPTHPLEPSDPKE